MKEAANSSPESSSGKRRSSKSSAAAEAETPDVEQMAESVQRAAQDVGTFVRQNATSRPYMTLGVAAGVGFVLGGGLSPRMTTTLLGFGGRLLFNAVMRDITESH